MLISGSVYCDNTPRPVYNCSSGLVLSFQSGSYTGATSTSVCNSGCGNCAAGCNYPSANVLSYLKSHCNGLNSCSIPFSTAPFGSDLCPNTLKALIATAVCVPSSPNPPSPPPLPPSPTAVGSGRSVLMPNVETQQIKLRISKIIS